MIEGMRRRVEYTYADTYVLVALPRLAACCCVIELVTGEMTQCGRMLPAIKLHRNQVPLVFDLSANCLVDAGL